MSVLQRIFDHKHDEVEAAKSRLSLADIIATAKDRPPTRGFLNALKGHPDLALIAEIKKASPSRGVIRADFDPTAIAQTYERTGANALSVLTDEAFFQGSADNLRLARKATSLPCLRKDFVDDPYQVYEARAWGADAILLIVAWLSDAQLADLSGLAISLGMDALIEVHTEEEAVRVQRYPLVGVNNRDLADFHTDLGTTERLMPLLADAQVRVSESALATRVDLDRVKAAGAGAVLIGTTFTSSPDIEAKVREVMGR